jgi:hypothetical protein
MAHPQLPLSTTMLGHISRSLRAGNAELALEILSQYHVPQALRQAIESRQANTSPAENLWQSVSDTARVKYQTCPQNKSHTQWGRRVPPARRSDRGPYLFLGRGRKSILQPKWSSGVSNRHPSLGLCAAQVLGRRPG